MAEFRKLYRSTNDKLLGGVCGGIGEYYNTDPQLVRLIVLALTLVSGVFPGVVTYLFAWWLVPENPGKQQKIVCQKNPKKP